MNFNHEADRELFQLEQEQLADRRFRSWIVGRLREDAEGLALSGEFVGFLQQALRNVDLRIAKRAFVAQTDPPRVLASGARVPASVS